MKRYAIMYEFNPRWLERRPEYEQRRFEFLRFRTRFFAKRDMRMLARSANGVSDYVLVDTQTDMELMRV